jgi:hypothetical protein
MKAYNTMTISEVLEKIERTDSFYVKPFLKLTSEQQELAREGLERHFKACDSLEVNYSRDAIREIIQDASHDRQIWKEPIPGEPEFNPIELVKHI